jgi:alkanesulfonate monooxygenase SsuD/methylene tetrahydromethanopterin reductase-like flavin-dependent oxidoreductase (luciferase family)
MQVGVLIPQGWKYEYNGWEPAAAWARTMELARDAEAQGFESEWVFDHFHTVPDVADEITFESFTLLTAMAVATTRVRLGHMVVCNGFRNPALVAKLASTIDVASGGRFELGIGAGWKQDEWLAYGYGFPPTGDRLKALRDALEVITRMLARAGRRITAASPGSWTRSTCRRGSSSPTRRSSSAGTAEK